MTFSALDSTLLGPLVATDAMRHVFSDEARVAAMLRTEAALARVQGRLGLVPDALAPAIDAIAPDTLDMAALGAETGLAGVPTIPFVKAVQKRLAPDVESAFHKGVTTQDIADTALVLTMQRAFALIVPDLDAILAALLRLTETNRDTLQVGRSYGQQAQPTSFGFAAAVWCAGVAEVAAELPGVRARALRVSLGGPVGTLAGLGADGPRVADGVAAELGLGSAPIAWHTRRAAMAGTGAWLATLIGALAKIAGDVVDLGSTEIGEVAEPHVPGRGGSSAMPHKRNPVSSTVILAAHGAAPGFVVTLLHAMDARHQRPAGAWHSEWHALPSLFGLASGALAEARRLTEGMTIDVARMRQNLDATRGLLFADAVASRLAAALGGAGSHRKLEEAAGLVRETGRSLRDVLADDPDVAARLPAADLDRAFDPTPAVRAASGWIDRVAHDTARVRATLAHD